jgi:hypothetical protein
MRKAIQGGSRARKARKEYGKERIWLDKIQNIC